MRELAKPEPVRPDRPPAQQPPVAAPLSAASLLQLQRTAGNQAVVRMLARQPADALPELMDPSLEENPYDRMMAEQAQVGAELRTRMIETLSGRDAILFLSRLRSLTDFERLALREDAEFWTQLRRRLSGMAYWAVQLILHYGRRRPPEVNELTAAVHASDHRRTRRLLMGYDSLKSVPGLREAIAAKFGVREATDLRAILAEAQTRAESGHRTYNEAIYDGGVLKRFTGDRNYELVRLSNQVRVIVRIRLYEDPANTQRGITDEVIASWENAISRRWNNKFRLRCGARRLDVWFLPIFVYHDEMAHFQVKVTADDKRADETNWHSLRDADHAAHEFGHMLGNPDEYAIAGSMAEIPAALGLTDAEKRRSSVEGLTGTAAPADPQGHDLENLMGARRRNARVLERHAWDVLETFNAHLRRPGEDPWTVELR